MNERIWLAAWILLIAWPATAGQWHLRAMDWENLRTDSHSTIPRSEKSVSYTDESWRSRRQYSYAHQPLLIRAGEPAHNGYLHQFDAHYERQRFRWRGEIKAGIHGSSNMFKHGDFHHEALVVTGGATYEMYNSWVNELGWHGDYRFGNFQVYPRLISRWTPTRNTELIIDLPVGLMWRGQDGSWQIGVERYGEKWATLDKERKVESALYLQEWRLSGWRRDAVFGRGPLLELGFGLSIDTRIRQRDLQQGLQTIKPENANYFSMGLLF